MAASDALRTSQTASPAASVVILPAPPVILVAAAAARTMAATTEPTPTIEEALASTTPVTTVDARCRTDDMHERNADERGHANNGRDSTTGAESDAVVLQRITTTGPGKHCVAFPADGLRFSSRFDGGSMQSVTRVATDTFHVVVAEDAAASGISTGYTTWFYFELETIASVKPFATATSPALVSTSGSSSDHTTNTSKAKTKVATATATDRNVRLVLTNMNGQKGLYAHGYTVMYCAVDAAATVHSDSDRAFDDEHHWRRISAPLTFDKYTVPLASSTVGGSSTNDSISENDDRTGACPIRATASAAAGATHTSEVKVSLAFTYAFQFVHERVRFAFCYPHSYTRLQRQLAAFDTQQQQQQQTGGSDASAAAITNTANAAIYYHRELLTRSLEGLRVDLLTISSYEAITTQRDAPLDGVHTASSSSDSFAALGGANNSKRALAFDPQRKKTVLITARVHPAETPASYMLDGMLALLLDTTDVYAAALRRHFVFKVVPMLNPDGVCQGFYRTDTRGVNLNRVYEAPCRLLAPTVFAAKALLLQLVERHGGAWSDGAAQSVVFLDLHAHANRRGCFVYGNSLLEHANGGLAKQIETQLFARLVALHSQFFDYAVCAFDQANMARDDKRDNGTATPSRRGSSRVALFHATGLTFVYTLECNYNEGRRRNVRRSLSATANAKAEAASSRKTRLYAKYSPVEWSDVGSGALVALLDLFELPGRGTTVQESPFESLDGIRKNLSTEIQSLELGSCVASRHRSSSSNTDRSGERCRI